MNEYKFEETLIKVLGQVAELSVRVAKLEERTGNMQQIVFKDENGNVGYKMLATEKE